jgi:hypothetical protein
MPFESLPERRRCDRENVAELACFEEEAASEE